MDRQLTKILDQEKSKNNFSSYLYNPTTKHLKIEGARIFPPISEFGDDIEILDLSKGYLSKLPEEFVKMNKLQVLFLSENDFKEIPPVIAKIPNLKFLGMKSCQITSISETVLPKTLRWLTLTNNHINKLPKSIGQLKNLEKLLLSGNQLSTLPLEILQCQNLALIRISANNFQSSPLEMLSSLPKLAWYADAGNPFCHKNIVNTISVNIIPWDNISLQEKIGESAQNKIYRAKIKKNNQIVAVKIFGSEINSDGCSEDDIKASLHAGTHPHLIGAIGKIDDAPNGQKALVLPIIPPNFHKLGNNPSFTTCTRDTFPDNTNFSIKYIATVLNGICQALIHLHSRGIMHGDLYAHNILVNENAYPYLGDFGSASLYSPSKNSLREKIDVCAFGYLIDGLLSNCFEKENPKYQTFEKIRDLCLTINPNSRPSFQEINNFFQ